MKLSKDQQKKITEKLSKYDKSTCPICGNDGSWKFSDVIFEICEYQRDSSLIGGERVLPVIPLTCDRCGHTQFLNALILGIVEQPIKKEVEDEC